MKDKKPLGLKPAHAVHEGRLLEIQRAMNRYMAECLPVPLEWIEEYNSLIEICKTPHHENQNQ